MKDGESSHFSTFFYIVKMYNIYKEFIENFVKKEISHSVNQWIIQMWR
jgi:hypothetical protein